MLQLLHIENIAVIERADISFRAGFNALTGETGAGKSIVIDSHRRGARRAHLARPDPHGRGQAPSSARNLTAWTPRFLCSPRSASSRRTAFCCSSATSMPTARTSAARTDGPSRSRSCARWGRSLLNIHGQHEGTQLLDEEQHGAYLDRFARLDGLPECLYRALSGGA